MARRRKKKPKRVSTRPLSLGDIRVLEFLWMWKAASIQMLGLVGYPKKSTWRVYRAVRQLEKEKYIERLPRGKFLQQDVFGLTELGFEAAVIDREDLKERRFQVHAPAHDYLATCLQLGDFWFSKFEKTFITEQMASSLIKEALPDRMRFSGHIPDGMTELGSGEKALLIGYEVDLNQKELSRYEESAKYHWSYAKSNTVVWLVRDLKLLEKVESAIQKGEKNAPSITAFVLLEDFRRDVWGAKIAKGYMAGETIRKLHAKELQKVGIDPANLKQFNMRGIFFKKHLSPQKQKEIQKGVNHEKA